MTAPTRAGWIVIVAILVIAGGLAAHFLVGKSATLIPRPPTTATVVAQPNGTKIHIVTSLPAPKPAPVTPSK